MVNAPSVLYIAPAMTRLPPSVTVTKASTGLSKTPPPWLVQVSRVLFKNWTFSDSGDILSFCLHVFNLFQSAVPYFPHPSALFFISNMIQLKLNLCLHNFIPPYLKFETKKNMFWCTSFMFVKTSDSCIHEIDWNEALANAYHPQTHPQLQISLRFAKLDVQ